MPAAKYNITIEEGSNFSLDFTWYAPNGTVVDLRGYSAKMQVRKNKNDSASIFEWSSSVGDIVLGGQFGTVALNIGAVETRDMNLPEGFKGYYDLELYTTSDDQVRVLEGRIKYSKEVTR